MLRARTCLIVLAAAFAALALVAGCRKDEPVAAEHEALTFWHIMTYDPPRQVLWGAIRLFLEANPGATVEVEDISNDAFKQKLATEMAGGEPPDVFHTWGGGVLAAYARAGKVLDLTEALAGPSLSEDLWRESFSPSALRFCTVAGAVYGVPLDMSVVPVWYNRDIFERHGLKPPSTFAELKAACRTLRAAGVTPLALGNVDQWPGAFYFVYLATRLGGTELFEKAAAGEDGVTFAHERFVQAGRLLRELVDLEAFSVGFNGLKTDQARAEFLDGRAAMYVMGTWLLARVKDERPEMMDRLGCFGFPAVAGGDGDARTVVGGTNAAFAVSSACASPELAIDLLKHLTDASIAEAWAGAGRLPAVKVGGGSAALTAPARDALTLLNAAPSIQLYYDQYLPPALGNAHKETTQAILAGVMTPEEAAEQMAWIAGASR